LPIGDHYTIEFWFWNGLPADARAVTGHLFSRGAAGDGMAPGEHLAIAGSASPELAGRLVLSNRSEPGNPVAGHTRLALKAWHHVVFVREGRRARLHLDGRAEPEIVAELEAAPLAGKHRILFGGRDDGSFGLEGRLDEIAVYTRVLGADEIAAHYAASALIPPIPSERPQ
jgi:hypothetical protein